MGTVSQKAKALWVGCVIVLSSLMIFAGCSEAPTGFTADTGSADVTIRLGRVGSLGKTASIASITLTRVIVMITSGNDKGVADTIILSGNQGQTVMKTYGKLACDKDWTLRVWTEDAKGMVVHSGGKIFRVESEKTTAVAIDLNADYSMVKANFFGIPEGISRCELVVNGQSVASETLVQDEMSDTLAQKNWTAENLQLAYDYLPTGISNKITLNAYGVSSGKTVLLYSADTILTALPGEDKSYVLVLRFVGPVIPPTGAASIQVVIGQIGTLTINGIFDHANFSSDSLAVRAILDANGYGSMALSNVASVASGRIILLNFTGFKLTKMPKEIGRLTALKSLYLGYNNLTALPPEIGHLTSLTILSIYHNPIFALPKEIGQLGQLQQLNAYCCNLSNLPEEISQLTNLTQLMISNNAIRRLPSNIGNCSNLTYIGAENNQITGIPASIGCLSKLSLLIIYDNQLSRLPAELCECRALTQINVSRNYISALPDSIGKQTELLSLIATGNQLTQLPPSIIHLKKLIRLALHSNSLCNLSEPISTWLDANREAWTTGDDWRTSQNCFR